jgi:hypothetical protein
MIKSEIKSRLVISAPLKDFPLFAVSIISPPYLSICEIFAISADLVRTIWPFGWEWDWQILCQKVINKNFDINSS